jgi:hypothetical protein
MRSVWNAARAISARVMLNVQPAAIGLFVLVAGATFLSTLGTAQAVGGTTTTTTLTSSPNPSQIQVNVPVTFTATVTGAGGTPTGTVTFVLDQGNTVQTEPLVNGVASFTMTFTSAGNGHTIQAGYNGDNTFATSTSNQINFNVNAAATLTATTTNLTSAPNPSQLNQTVTFTATVSGNGGTPTGTVTFTVDQGNTVQAEPLINGVAAFSISTLGTGTHTITATYSGDNTFATSTSNTITQNVNAATTLTATTTNLTSAPNPSQVGQTVTFSATITGNGGTPTGTVTFTVDQGNTVQAEPLINGVASFSTSTLTQGTHTITATYSGDNTFATSTSNTITQNVNAATTLTATTTNLTSTPNPSQVGQTVTFTATVAPQTGTGTPTGSVTFTVDQGNTTDTQPLVNGVASFSTLTLTQGTHTITAGYSGDNTFATSSSNTVTQAVATTVGTTTTLTSTPNPSAVGQAVTFTATVTATNGTTAPTGTVTFKDGGTTIGTGTLSSSGGTAAQTSFTTSTLTAGSHSITAVYSGAATFTATTSAVLVQVVNNSTSDSTKLREMQVSATPAIANIWGSTVAGAMDDAVSAGFGGNPQALSPNGTGFTYYFGGDQSAQDAPGQDALRRYLASPDGSISNNANASVNNNTKRVDDDFGALGYAGGTPTKAPPASASAVPHDWLAWINVRGSDYYRGTFGDDLKGEQVDAIAGLTRRITPNFVVGVLGGYEHFDYTSQAFNGVLKGDGWTTGIYMGFKLAPNLRFDVGGARSWIMVDDTAGTASGNFTGARWLVNGGLTGTYPWQQFVFEPSARVFALWEHENAFTDSLGTFQAARNFETGRASVGVKAIDPAAWSWGSVALSPYAGLYADYYFSQDDAQTVGLTTVPLLQGFAARVTGGVNAKFANGASLGAGGEFGGIGLSTHIWTWTARGSIPF